MSSSNLDAREARIAAARKSPELANLHDRHGWLALYAPDASVEDPVGAPACAHNAFTHSKKKDDLECFYEAFIAPVKSLRVEERRDVVVGDRVVRDVVLHVALPGGAQSAITAVLEYELVTTNGALLVRRMRAYWDAQANGRAVMKQGLRGQLASIFAGVNLFRAFGREGTMRYVNGTKQGVRREGAAKVEALAAALSSNDAHALDALATTDATVVLPGEAPRSLRAFDARALGLTLRPHLTSGFVSVARVEARVDGSPVQGIAFVEFERETKRIERVRLYWETR